MHIVARIAFIVLAIVAVLLFARKAKDIRANILLGRDEDFSDQPAERWKNVLLLALGQKKMFRKPIVAILHLIVYAGFVIINIEVLEIALDGLLGSHRLFARPMGSFYPAFINAFELLAVLVLTACVVFLIRRNIIKVPRLQWKELDGWPKSDANIILVVEI